MGAFRVQFSGSAAKSSYMNSVYCGSLILHFRYAYQCQSPWHHIYTAFYGGLQIARAFINKLTSIYWVFSTLSVFIILVILIYLVYHLTPKDCILKIMAASKPIDRIMFAYQYWSFWFKLRQQCCTCLKQATFPCNYRGVVKANCRCGLRQSWKVVSLKKWVNLGSQVSSQLPTSIPSTTLTFIKFGNGVGTTPHLIALHDTKATIPNDQTP